MTESLVRLADTLTVPPPIDTSAALLQGSVVSLGPPIRVDVGAMQLSCISIVGVNVGDAVYVLRTGNIAVIIGAASTTQYRGGAANVSFVSGAGTLTIAQAFPTQMLGAIVQMSANSVGPASLAVSAAAPASPSTITCNLNQVSTSGPFQCWYWAWGN
jgi:hypothetical protein